MSRDICVTAKNNLARLEFGAMTWWAQALNNLLAAKGLSKSQFAEHGKTSHRRLNRMYQGTKGPTLTSVKQVLDDLGATWFEWAEACAKVQDTQPDIKPHIKHPTRRPQGTSSRRLA